MFYNYISLFFRHLSILVFLAFIIPYFMIAFKTEQNTKLFKTTKCSSKNLKMLAIDFRDCFGFFDINQNCETICVKECPNKEENIELLKIIDKYNHTLSIGFLKTNNMCDSNFNLNENCTLTDLIENKTCASYVAASNSSLFLQDFCLPDFNSRNKSISYKIIIDNGFKLEKRSLPSAKKGYYYYYLFSALNKYFGDRRCKHR